MSGLREAVEEYLALRRACGFELRIEHSLLRGFVQWAEQEGADFITVDLALRWARLPADAQAAQWANRLGMVRRFAQYRRASDPRTEVPSQELLPYRYRRRSPYIYGSEEIDRLLCAARLLPSPTGLRAKTYETFLALLVVTGMRLSEATGLDRRDVDLVEGNLTIRRSKFGKSRRVPIHASTRRALRRYAADRQALYAKPVVDRFFLSEAGRPLRPDAVRSTFIKLSRQVGLRGPLDRHGPRLHDFRHRFAVETLAKWYRDGVDVERHLPRLSTYLGHVHTQDTYWYLTAVPQLMQSAIARYEKQWSEREIP